MAPGDDRSVVAEQETAEGAAAGDQCEIGRRAAIGCVGVHGSCPANGGDWSGNIQRNPEKCNAELRHAMKVGSAQYGKHVD